MKRRIFASQSGLPSNEVTERNNNAQLYRKTGTNSYIPLIARILLSAIFIKTGIDKILDPGATQQAMAAKGIPLTALFLVATIAVELGGGLSVLLGYKARWGAIALIIFLIPATIIFHTNFAEPMQTIAFMKNLAILGGLLMIVEYGAGRIALERNR